MKHSRDAGYYRRREKIELERAEHASHSAARRAHLGLAALYRRELENALLIERIDLDPSMHPAIA